MQTYPGIHRGTGETQELSMAVIEYTKWREENPEWDKDWSQGFAAVGEVGDWQNKLTNKHPGWNEVLTKASKAPGSRVKPL